MNLTDAQFEAIMKSLLQLRGSLTLIWLWLMVIAMTLFFKL